MEKDRPATTSIQDASSPPPASVQRVTLYMWVFTSVLCLVAWIANFDYGYSGIVIAMPAFSTAFGSCVTPPDSTMPVCALTALQQSLTSLASLFQGVGSVLAGITGAYIGRRGTIVTGCLLVVAGDAGMLGTSASYTNYMVCKAIAAIGIGQLLVAGITYGTECAPASKRGLLMGLYSFALAVGNVASAAVCAGSATLSPRSNWQWKTPIACQIPLSLALGGLILLFPDSPRWLLTKGREQQARKALGKFFSLHEDSVDITAQVHDIQSHIEAERAFSAISSWTEIYRSPDFRRTLVSASILIGLVITGIQFVVPYTALFLEDVGLANSFVINVIINSCILAGSLIGPFMVEYGGRRFTLLLGYSIMASSMLIFSAISSGLGAASSVSQQTLVAFLCIWSFAFGAFISPSAWLASAEMHSVRLRTYGQANTTLLSSTFGFAAQFWTPYMLSAHYGNMGTNVGYFYFGLTLIVATITFFFVPETARLTLEQMDEYFASDRMAWRTSIGRNKRIARGEVGN